MVAKSTVFISCFPYLPPNFLFIKTRAYVGLRAQSYSSITSSFLLVCFVFLAKCLMTYGILVLQPWAESVALALKHSLNYWTTREAPEVTSSKQLIISVILFQNKVMFSNTGKLEIKYIHFGAGGYTINP